MCAGANFQMQYSKNMESVANHGTLIPPLSAMLDVRIWAEDSPLVRKVFRPIAGTDDVNLRSCLANWRLTTGHWLLATDYCSFAYFAFACW